MFVISRKKLPLSAIIIHVLLIMIKKGYKSYFYASTTYQVLAIIFLKFIFENHCYIFIFLSKLLFIGFFEIRKKISDLSIFPLLFSKKELKNTKEISYSYKITSISCIMVLFIIAYFENLDDKKQRIDVITDYDKFLKKAKNPLNVVPSLWLNDNDMFWNVGLGCTNESIDQGRSYLDKNINISNCFFSRNSLYDGNGGVISVYLGYFSMNINNSMFYYCASSGQGGAIYFSSSNSSLRKICANSCSCGASCHGHFAILSASKENMVEYLSVSNSSHTTSGYESIRLQKSYQRIDNTNSSMNNAISYSGIFIDSPTSFTSSYCTFSNNKVSNSICIYFYYGSDTISMSFANIVHNNSPSNGVVYANGGGLRKMLFCIFHNNQNYLFCVRDGSLEVSHSFIDHPFSSFSRSTAVSTDNSSLTNRITYQLQFFNSLHCNADIPLEEISLEETLRMTYYRTPDQTIRETQNETPYRTYSELLCTYRMANWREISYIFAFVYAVIFLSIS